ncbi:hypothetical protein HMPREF1624_02400 [Sporothrix schenckii ATCC 58251]|uniref:Uncharacterized protein n=1 Tax=Sporothrix schenckii (strain ATCC 58251 / de Perez 2211183) TaxID=1391915 RepID=U7PZS5_SPOS1|nr:hypothetical protein HMPREF1624_02400 [Sporothrix schenckii ATCC 58251]
MCIIQPYTAWHCGCRIEENDPALVQICIAKARNAEAKCTLPQESCDSSSSSDSGDSVEDLVESKAGQNSGVMDTCSEDADSGDADGWHEKSIEDEILADDTQSRRLQAPISPRMCPEHEAKFENLANAYWRSETLWLRPKMLNHGRRAYQDLVLAQRCADRLWELYLVWKFFNGGDPHGAAIVTGPDFQPLYRTGSGADEVCGNDNTARNLKDVAEVDASRTLRAVSNFGDVTYRVLRWALDDLLTVLRDMLHPSEMLA